MPRAPGIAILIFFATAALLICAVRRLRDRPALPCATMNQHEGGHDDEAEARVRAAVARIENTNPNTELRALEGEAVVNDLSGTSLLRTSSRRR